MSPKGARGAPKPKKPATGLVGAGNRHFLPLLCVYRAYELRRDPRTDELIEVVYTKPMCLKKAPRHRARLDDAAFPNRYGEPLCRDHAHLGEDRYAYRDGDVEPMRTYKREEKGAGRISRGVDRLVELMLKAGRDGR